MANARSILPELIRVSRNCGLTNELHSILSEKLTDHDFDVLHRWLQIVEQEKYIEVSREKNRFRF
jgi:hypothetical protein